MFTGIGAWIANYKFDNVDEVARIDLPGGWHWDVSANGTGFLKNSEDQLCVGYDLNNETIRFGNDGETKAPGLNLWIIQEMGEKFARENFMNDNTIKEYDKFATERMNERREYEKGIRTYLSGIVQLELNEGQWFTHVDTDAVKSMTGIETKSELSREEGIALFNKMSETRHVMPLRDPTGYMALDNNIYNYIKDQYRFQYTDMIQNIDAGFINGNGYGCEAVLNKLDSAVRKNVREYCLPDTINYQDLRFMHATPEIRTAVNEFVKCRVTLTVDFEKKRSHSPESIERDRCKFIAAGETLKDKINDIASPFMDVPLTDDNSMKIE